MQMQSAGTLRSQARNAPSAAKRCAVMKEFDPIKDVEDSQLILDHGEWPNFHDADARRLFQPLDFYEEKKT